MTNTPAKQEERRAASAPPPAYTDPSANGFTPKGSAGVLAGIFYVRTVKDVKNVRRATLPYRTVMRGLNLHPNRILTEAVRPMTHSGRPGSHRQHELSVGTNTLSR